METTLSKTDYERYFSNGVNYESYFKEVEEKVAKGSDDKYAEYYPMNFQRMKRIGKTVVLSEEVRTALRALHHPVKWLVISEYWCGDASQILPVINAITEASNGNIELRIVYRDQNLELMDQYLTNGGRAIPKLIQLDTKYNVTGIWGPRPNEAQELVKQLKANPETADKYSDHLHKWYADNKTAFIQRDLLKLIHRAIAFCPHCLAR